MRQRSLSQIVQSPGCSGDMRVGTETALARVIGVFGSAKPHCAYLFANRHATRMKVLVHDGIGVWLAARMIMLAFDRAGLQISSSVGCGFVVDEGAMGLDRIVKDRRPLRYPFLTGQKLLEQCTRCGLSARQLMAENKKAWRSPEETRQGLLHIWQVMQDCVLAGCRTEGIMPSGLKVKRRAAALYRQLIGSPEANLRDSLSVLDWVNLYALAVNEENVSGGRIVTAPTNSAAGIVPAVLHYYRRFVPGADEEGVQRCLLTAAAIGILYKENASLSGAEVGCPGEVGVACNK